MFVNEFQALKSIFRFTHLLAPRQRVSKKNGFCDAEKIHITNRKHCFPAAKEFVIPNNTYLTKSSLFSLQRTPDMSETLKLSHQKRQDKRSFNVSKVIDVSINTESQLEYYDCFGDVILNSAKQSNVPCNIGVMHLITHLNQQWKNGNNFISQNTHYMNLRKKGSISLKSFNQEAGFNKSLVKIINNNKINVHAQLSELKNKISFNTNMKIRSFCTEKSVESTRNIENKNKNTLQKKNRLKKAFKEYGSIVIVFHVGISLISLGIFYFLVSGGLDVVAVFKYLGLASTAISSKIATETSTFLVAYAIHKVFAPVRMSITLAATPLIVRYLRSKGFF